MSRRPRSHCEAAISGLKWPPVAGPNDSVSATTAAGTPSASASGCRAPSEIARAERITAMVSAAVATPSAAARRANEGRCAPS